MVDALALTAMAQSADETREVYSAELVAIFLMRTAILIPVVALLTHLLERAGMLAGS